MSQPAPDDPLELQQELCETSLPLLFETFDEAVEDGIKRPVVILLDCADEIGGGIARAWLGDDEVDAALDEYAEGELTTVYARALPFADAQRDFTQLFPYLGPVFDEPPDDNGFLVLSITAGGASALTVPHDARPESGQ
jgi:hypothetical protein